MFILIRLIDLYSVIVIISAIASWLPVSRSNPFIRILDALTAPVYSVIHKVLNPAKTGGIDLSPIVVLVALSALKQFLLRLA